MKKFLLLSLFGLFAALSNPVCAKEVNPDIERLRSSLARSEQLAANGKYDEALVELDLFRAMRFFRLKFKKDVSDLRTRWNAHCHRIIEYYVARNDLEKTYLWACSYLEIGRCDGAVWLSSYDDPWNAIINADIPNTVKDYWERQCVMQEFADHYLSVSATGISVRDPYRYGYGSSKPVKQLLDELQLIYDKEAVFYYNWYFVREGDLAEIYDAEYKIHCNKDLIELYGAYPPIAKRVIQKLWLGDADFERLCSSDRTLAIKYALYCDDKVSYAYAISKTRPEEAFEITSLTKYIEPHRRNLAKWKLTELEYQQERLKYTNWDDFYAAMEPKSEAYVAAVEAEKQAQMRREADRHAAEHRRQEAYREADRKIVAECKPEVVSAMQADDYAEADRLAAAVLDRMHGGDAYLYYVRAYAYYKKKLDLDVEFDEDVTAYHQAYRDEAQELVRLCIRSIGLDSSSGNKAYYLRGIAYGYLHQCADAVHDFQIAMGCYDKASCFYSIGITYANDKQYQLAVENMKQAHSLSQDQTERSRCLDRIKTYQEYL